MDIINIKTFTCFFFFYLNVICMLPIMNGMVMRPPLDLSAGILCWLLLAISLTSEEGSIFFSITLWLSSSGSRKKIIIIITKKPQQWRSARISCLSEITAILLWTPGQRKHYSLRVRTGKIYKTVVVVLGNQEYKRTSQKCFKRELR